MQVTFAMFELGLAEDFLKHTFVTPAIAAECAKNRKKKQN